MTAGDGALRTAYSAVTRPCGLKVVDRRMVRVRRWQGDDSFEFNNPAAWVWNCREREVSLPLSD